MFVKNCFVAVVLEIRCPTGLMDLPINDLFTGCLEVYSSDSEDRTPFHLPNWIPLKNYSHFRSADDICPKPWRYNSSSQINTLSHEAVKETYDGGGYLADLGYNKESASEVVRDLRAHNWVDERTAAVFIEFTLFDPSTSLFCKVRKVYERLPTGQAVTAVDVRTLSLYPSPNVNFQSFYEVCQLLFLIIIVVFFIAETIKCFRQKRYFRQLWNWVEVILLVVSLAAVVTSFLKGKYTSLYVKQIQSNPYDTFSADFITRLFDLETFFLSAAIFIITLKLLRLIRFNPQVCHLQGILRTSARPILSFSLVFTVTVVAAAQFGYLCFGTMLVRFSSFAGSLRIVLEMSALNANDSAEIHQKYPVLGPLYLILFTMAMSFVLINVFVAILVEAFDHVRKQKEGVRLADAELGSYMYNVFLKRMKEFPGKIAIAMKLLLNKTPRKPPGKMIHRITKHSRKSTSFAKVLEEENADGIELKTFQPAVPLASPESSDVEEASDNEVQEDYILTEIKTLVAEVLTELKSVR